MNFYLFFNVVLIMIFGFVSSYTDIKHSKIYNKHILLFVIIALTFNVLYFTLINKTDNLGYSYLEKLLINAFIALLVSYLLYASKIWAAGDSKAFFLFNLLTPLEFYEKGFSVFFWGFTILMNIFAIALIYIILDTFYHLAMEYYGTKRISLPRQIAINKDTFVLGFMRVLFAIVSAYLFNYLVLNFFVDIFESNAAFIQLIYFIALIMVLRKTESLKRLTLYILSEVFILLVLNFTYNRIFFVAGVLNYKVVLVVLLLILLRYFSGKFDYKEITIDQLKAGMVLSISDILLLSKANMKEVPEYGSRLTSDEVLKIKEFVNKKVKTNSFTIVRKIPFAPILFLGVIAQLIFREYIFL